MKRWIGLLVLAISCLPVFAQQGITVSGKVEFDVKAASRAADRSNVAVWLTPLESSQQKVSSAPGHQQLLQKNKSFVPHLLVVQVGSTVDFPNQDPFFHNVFSLFDGKRFDLGLYEAGSTRGVVFGKPGVSYIFCNIHPQMSAVVIAVKTPYYGVSNKRGVVTIANVPAGRYEMQVWNERLTPETLNRFTRTVEISSTANSLGTIRLPEQRSPTETHKNKYGEDYDPRDNPRYPRP